MKNIINNTEAKKMTTLTEEQKQKVASYLESRLGAYGIRSYQFVWSETVARFSETSDVAIAPIEMKYCGILQYMLSSCQLEVRTYFNKEGNYHTARVSFAYNHNDGGSNGHDTAIKLRINKDSVFEIQ